LRRGGQMCRGIRKKGPSTIFSGGGRDTKKIFNGGGKEIKNKKRGRKRGEHLLKRPFKHSKKVETC